MGAVRRKIGARLRRQRIGACLRLTQAVGGDHFTARQLGQVLLLLLFGAEQQQRQRADAGVRAVPRRIRPVARHAFRHHHHRRQVHLHAAEFLGNHHSRQPKLGRLLENFCGHGVLLVLNLFQVRRNLFCEELLGGFRDRAMLRRKILGRENLFRRAGFDQKRPALDFGNCNSRGGHTVLLG